MSKKENLSLQLRKPLDPQKESRSNRPIFIAIDARVVSKKPTRVTELRDPTIGYSYWQGKKGQSDWNPPEYDLGQIQKIEDVESYVRRAFSKKAGLMFKEGWDLVGKNLQVVDYLKLRFDQIADATGTPTDLLLRNIGIGLIKKSNTFIVKVRDIEASGGAVRKDDTGKQIEPIAGYFILPAETMEYQMVANQISRWRQNVPPGYLKEFGPDEIIHIFYERKDGFIFGTPVVIPVIDDIRALRKIEENIELLVYQHLFPLFQWQVGTKESPAGTDETGRKEVDIVREQIQYMPSEGGIVTTERHTVTAIGAEGRALRAEGYVDHFKKRVFAGLGMSGVDYGEAATVNRSTSDNLSQDLIDSVKDFQRVVEIFVNELIVKELLLEADFDFDVLAKENRVWLKFKEIDLEKQIRKETHLADQFTKNVVTLDEARIGAGRDVIEIPTAEEIDGGTDDITKYPDWNKTFWMLMDRPKLLIQSVDEVYYANIAKARAAAEATKAADRQAKAATKRTADEDAILSIKDQEVTHGTEARLSHTLLDRYHQTKEDISDYVGRQENIDTRLVNKMVNASLQDIFEKLKQEQLNAFRQGYSKLRNRKDDKFFNSMMKYKGRLHQRLHKYFDKLVKDTTKELDKHFAELDDKKQYARVVRDVFDSFVYRVDAIEDVEFRKAYHLGWCVALKDAQDKNHKEKAEVKINSLGCNKCGKFDDFKVDINKMDMLDIPPYHPNCNCKFELFSDDFVVAKDEVVDNNENHDNNIEDAPAKLERCVLGVKKSLRKRYPSWSEDKVKESAFKICNSRISNEK